MFCRSVNRWCVALLNWLRRVMVRNEGSRMERAMVRPAKPAWRRRLAT